MSDSVRQGSLKKMYYLVQYIIIYNVLFGTKPSVRADRMEPLGETTFDTGENMSLSSTELIFCSLLS